MNKSDHRKSRNSCTSDVREATAQDRVSAVPKQRTSVQNKDEILHTSKDRQTNQHSSGQQLPEGPVHPPHPMTAHSTKEGRSSHCYFPQLLTLSMLNNCLHLRSRNPTAMYQATRNGLVSYVHPKQVKECLRKNYS